MKRGRHALEWTVLALSVAALATLVALLVYDGVTRVGDPELAIALHAPESQGEQWVVPFVVANEGASAASGVDVEVALLVGGEERETGTVTIPFVPEGSDVDAAVVLRTDPATGRLEPRVLGYELP